MDVNRLSGIKQPQIGQFIRELRLATKLTQEKFAAYVGVTYSSVNRWENGRGKPSPLATLRIEGLLQQTGEQGKALLAKYLTN